jgi:hypothetical protein
MSRRTVIVCDLCGAEQPGTPPPVAWAGADVCSSCLSSTRPVREVLEAVTRVTATMPAMVTPADILPERTRPT